VQLEKSLCQMRPELMLLDVELIGCDPFQVLELASRIAPAAAVIAVSGGVDTEQAFHLAQRGVRVYLKKPLTAEQLRQAIHQALCQKPDIVPQLRAAVGLVGIRELEHTVRRTMIAEALARCGGNRSGAARLLEVSRQLLQYMMRRDQIDEP
jgi:DNA-binding NtrC family response regulator